MNCFDRIQANLQEKNEKVALTGVIGQTESSRFTFKDLLSEVNLLKSALLKQGVKAGDSVLIELCLCPESLVSILSCLSLGALAVPINPSISQEGRLEITQDIQPTLSIVESKRLSSNNNSFIYSELIAEYVEEECDETAVEFNLDNDNPVLLMHTSGSTGRPRKILYNLAQLTNFMNRHDFLYRQFSDISGEQKYESDLLLSLLLSHFGGICLCLQALMMGRTLHMLNSFLPEDYLALANKKALVLLVMVPSMYEKLLGLVSEGNKRNTVKYCIAMGEPCSGKLASAIEVHFKAKVFSTYGLSECQTGIGHEQALIDKGEVAAGSCGRLLFGEVRLINANGEQCNSGELWVRNETAFPCYSDYSLNHQAYYKGWFKTGDLLRRDKSGSYFHCGRKDSMFIVNGKNIYPLEVESIFIQHPAFSAAIVLPLLSATGKTFPGLILKPDSFFLGLLPSKEVIIDFYLKQGNIHATPGWVLLMKNLPLNNTGKVDRITCNELLQNEYEAHCYSKAS